MGKTIFSLLVSDPGGCRLLATGDRWFFNGTEVTAQPGTKLCAEALAEFYPQLKEMIQGLASGQRPASASFVCPSIECLAVFRFEHLTEKGGSVPSAAATVVRRLERQALDAAPQSAWPFLKRVPADVASHVIAASKRVTFQSGEMILTEGVQGERLFTVEAGHVEVLRRSPAEGSEMVLAVLGPGECFGEMSLLTGQPTSAGVRARGEVRVLALERDVFEALLADSPALHRAFSRLLAERLRALNTALEKELSRGILGKLTMISTLDLVQSLHASRRTGTLLVTRDGREARVDFREGKVRSAVLGETRGDEAFYALLKWTEGDFCFEGPRAEEDTAAQVRLDTMGLLMEGLRRLDEAQAPAAGET